MKRFAKGRLAVGLTALILASHAWGADTSVLPEEKRTKLALYVQAREVPALIQRIGAGKLLFLDLRTRAEAMYVGMPDGVDALVPFVEHQEFMTDWDDKRASYKLEPFQDFVPEVRRRLEEKGLSTSDVLVLICRSGDRSARAANRLAEIGFAKVYSVVDGFEGDIAREGPHAGRRALNGWKNAGLPWSYKLDKAKMYFAR